MATEYICMYVYVHLCAPAHIHAQRKWNKLCCGSYREVDLDESWHHKSYHNFYHKSYPKAIVTKMGAQTNKSSDSAWDSPIFLNESVINWWFLATLSTIHFCWQARQFERPKGRKLQDCKKNGVKLKKWPNPCACQQKWTCSMQRHKRTLQLENCKSGQTAVPVDKNGQGR